MSDIQFWKPIYQLFKHDQPLMKQDLEDFYVRREDSPVENLVNVLAMEDTAGQYLLSGHRGGGKTTELRRLEQRCQADYTVVWVDTDLALDKFNLGYAEVVVLMGMQIVQCLQAQGWLLPPELEENLCRSLAKVTYQEKTDAAGSLQLPKLYQDLGMLLKVGFQRQTQRTREVRPALSEILAQVNAIIAAAEAETPKLLVIVDGLDRKEFGTALEMFSSSLLTALNCHAVYAIPIALRYAPAFRQPMQSFQKCLDLANIPVFKCDDRGRPTAHPDRLGRHILKQVVEKRLAKLGEAYPDLYPDLFDAAALELLMEKSGGVMRDLVRLVRTTCEEALQKRVRHVDLALARAGVRQERKDYTIADYQFPVLDRVHRSGQLTSETFDSPQAGKIVICDELLHYKLILGYEDPERGRWFDVNPMLLADLERWRGAMAGEKEGSEA